MNQGFRQRLVRSFAPLALVPLLIAFQLIYIWASQELEEREVRELERGVGAEARAVAAIVDRAQGDLLILSRQSSLRNFLQNREYKLIPEAAVDLADFEAFARDVTARGPCYAALRLHEPGGAILCSIDTPGAVPSRVDHRGCSRSIAATGGVMCHLCQEGASPRLCLEIAAAARPGPNESWLSLELAWDRLTAGLNALSKSRRIGLVVHDASEHEFYRTRRIEVSTSDVLAVVSQPIPALQWTIRATLARGAALEALWALRLRLGAVLAISVALLVAVTIGTANRFSRPLQVLAASAEAIGNESFETRVNIQPTAAEIEVLARSFNAMAEKLEQLHGDNLSHIETLTTTQAQLVQAEKLSAVGRLTAGVAHEINNPVQSLQNNLYVVTQLLARQGAVDSSIDRRLASMREGLLRVQHIVRGLLDYSRRPGGALRREAVNLNSICETAIHSLEHRLEVFQLELSLEARAAVHADATELTQVLVNLLTNAADATPPGGRLGVKTRDSAFTEQESIVRGLVERRPFVRRSNAQGPADGEPAVMIEVWDTGPGITTEDKSKVFDPFFTTKPLGQGTGLGLSIVHGIVKEHDGAIVVVSAPGGPTSFIIKLPIHRTVSPCPGESRGA